MGYYYYLAPQLSYLTYGQEVPMSSLAFAAMAQQTMSPSDAALLEYCNLDPVPAPATHSKLINSWKEWEIALRLNLAKGRAQKLKRGGDAYSDAPEFPADAVAAAKAALAIDSPLEAELFLDKARWEAIESFQGISVFSEDAMYAYLLKLLILERRARFDAEEGFNEYKALYAAILGEAK